MSIRTKLGTLIVNVGKNEKWIQYSFKNPARVKWGLKSVVKRYDSNGELSKIIQEYSVNPLLGRQIVSGTPKQMCTIWQAIAQMTDKESVSRFLETLM